MRFICTTQKDCAVTIHLCFRILEIERMETLQEKIFKVVEEQIDIKDFESWLYAERHLSERMDESLILELYSFNYNQIGVKYEFKKLFLSFFDEGKFTNWKIITNLKALSEGCDKPKRILQDFIDLERAGYPYLQRIGYSLYSLEDCEYYGLNKQEMINDIQKEAELLLSEIQIWLQTTSGPDLKNFESKPENMEEILIIVSEDELTNEMETKKWWKFWK